ncbi:hypothetical protein N9W41_00505 [bacterium]|nr:hypothetical protein [bacterium]
MGGSNCGLTSLGNVFCWGSDQNGSLGNGGADTPEIIPVAIDTTNLAVGEKFTSFTAGSYHACGMTSMGNSFCWGDPGSGRIGDGTNTQRLIPTAVDISPLQ